VKHDAELEELVTPRGHLAGDPPNQERRKSNRMKSTGRWRMDYAW